MVSWDDLRFVLAVGREGGLSAGARALGVNHSTVSRRIGALEAGLGVRLFDRLPGGLVATEAGERTLETAKRVESEVMALDRNLAGRDRALTGSLTVTAPQLLIQAHLAEAFLKFRQRHPGIDIVVNASNVPLNLHRREADVAIRVADAPEETLFGRCAVSQRRAFYASKAYYASSIGVIEAPDDVSGLDCLGFTWWGDAPPEALRARFPQSRVVMRFDDMVAVLAAARAGMGIALLPCFLGDPDPALVRLPDIPPEPYLDIWVLTHPDLRRVARVRTFMSFIADDLKAREDLYMGRPGGELSL